MFGKMLGTKNPKWRKMNKFLLLIPMLMGIFLLYAVQAQKFQITLSVSEPATMLLSGLGLLGLGAYLRGKSKKL